MHPSLFPGLYHSSIRMFPNSPLNSVGVCVCEREMSEDHLFKDNKWGAINAGLLWHGGSCTKSDRAGRCCTPPNPPSIPPASPPDPVTPRSVLTFSRLFLFPNLSLGKSADPLSCPSTRRTPPPPGSCNMVWDHHCESWLVSQKQWETGENMHKIKTEIKIYTYLGPMKGEGEETFIMWWVRFGNVAGLTRKQHNHTVCVCVCERVIECVSVYNRSHVTVLPSGSVRNNRPGIFRFLVLLNRNMSLLCCNTCLQAHSGSCSPVWELLQMHLR